MLNKKLAIKIVLIIMTSLTTSCVTLRVSYTYILKNTDSGRKYNFFKDIAEGYDLRFNVIGKTIENEIIPLLGEEKYIIKEPYDLLFQMEDFLLKKISFNKIILHTKNDTVNIRDKIEVLYGVNDFSDQRWPLNENDMQSFKDYGIIDISKIEKYHHMLFLNYIDIDIQYKKDKKFDIEFDITLEKKDGEIINKILYAEFVREKFVSRFPMIIYPFLKWI
jgi:hypothetical protein